VKAKELIKYQSSDFKGRVLMSREDYLYGDPDYPIEAYPRSEVQVRTPDFKAGHGIEREVFAKIQTNLQPLTRI